MLKHFLCSGNNRLSKLLSLLIFKSEGIIGFVNEYAEGLNLPYFKVHKH